ncbi:MAG: hypothetical protein Roseis2KO_21320 [Roseivirga sp.]
MLLLAGMFTHAQSLQAIFPIVYPKIDYSNDNGCDYFEELNIKHCKGMKFFAGNDLIYECPFPVYYTYLVEVFSSGRNFVLITPLPKKETDIAPTPYLIDRGIMYVFDPENGKRYYCDMSPIKRITFPQVFEQIKNEDYAFKITGVDVSNKRLALLQGGKTQKEVTISLREW